MKEFKNLTEAVTYHRKCYVCKSHLQSEPLLTTTLYYSGNIYKWNLSENVDSETDDWIIVNANTNQIDSFSQNRRYNDEVLCDSISDRVVERFRKYAKNISKSYNGLIYESIILECHKCHQFNYTVQVVIDMTAKMLKGIFLNSEFISYQDNHGHLHEIKNIYAIDKTEYDYHVTPTEEYDGSKKRMSVPIIPLDLENPADTVARIRKLMIFS